LFGAVKVYVKTHINFMNRKTTFKGKLPVLQERSSITCPEIFSEGAMPAQKWCRSAL
jgi:hypothetical protein